MKIIIHDPSKALEYDEIPDGSVFDFPIGKSVYFLKLRNGDGAVSLQNSDLYPASNFVCEGKKFYLVDAELVIK